MPVRSTGCLTCRKRKIRCDEARPGCERCATHGVPCPGYRADQPAGIEFKDQTTITAKRAEKRYSKARSSGSSQTSAAPASSTLVSGSATSTSTTSSRPGAKDDLSKQRDLLAVATRGLSPPASVMSPVANRAQIYQEFITSYFPKKRYGDQSGYLTFFQSIVVKRSEQAALEHSLDALSLVQLGSLHRDQRLLKEAVGRYGVALRSLSNCITRGDFMRDDDVLAAVSTLSICELFEEISNVGEGWAAHIQGSNVLLAARGPASFTSASALILYTNVKHASFLWALILRKKPFLAAPEWRELAFRNVRSISDSETRFYDIALQIPELLQRHDEIDVESPTAVVEIDGVLQGSAEMEVKMRQWWTDWQDGATVDDMVDCELRPIEDFATFTSLVADRTFDHAYLFPDFQTGYQFSLYWMVMHYLRTNIQSLQKMRHGILVDWYPEPDDVVPEDELLSYILNLCQCMPFFVEPISCSAGHIGIFLPLRMAAFYFTDHGHWRWLKWIGTVRNHVFTKGLVPPSVPGRSAGLPIRPQPVELSK